MPKKLHHHSIHFDSEVQGLVDAKIAAGNFRSLNSFVEFLIRKECDSPEKRIAAAVLTCLQASAEIAKTAAEIANG